MNTEEISPTAVPTKPEPRPRRKLTPKPDLPAPVLLEEVAPPQPSQPPLSTRPGDTGWTTFTDTGQLVSKAHHPQLRIVQALDEVTSLLGIARAHLNAEWARPLHQIQCDLISLQQCWQRENDQLPWGGIVPALEVLARGQESLLKLFTQQFNRTDYFPVPSGHPAAATLFFAKSVCWRAELVLHSWVDRAHPHYEVTSVYLNQLSRLLVLMARRANRSFGSVDLVLQPDAPLGEPTEVKPAGSSVPLLNPSGPNRQQRREQKRRRQR